MKYLESPWAILVLALGFITMIEVLHMNAHTNLENLYVPQKSKETQFIDGTTDEVVEKLVDVLKNEIKVMN